MGKERKIAKTDKNFNIFGVARKSTKGEEIGKIRGVGEEDPISHKGSKRSRLLMLSQYFKILCLN